MATYHVALKKLYGTGGVLEQQEGQTWSCCGGSDLGQSYTERLRGEDGLYHKTGNTKFVYFSEMLNEPKPYGRYKLVDTGTRFLGDDYGLFLEELA